MGEIQADTNSIQEHACAIVKAGQAVSANFGSAHSGLLAAASGPAHPGVMEAMTSFIAAAQRAHQACAARVVGLGVAAHAAASGYLDTDCSSASTIGSADK